MKESTPNNTSDDTNQDQQPTNDLEQVKIMAALAYFGILFFLPLVTHPNSSFGKFHANQALILFITAIIINVVGTLLPVIGWFVILPLGGLFTLVLFVMGIINALNLEKKRLPLIGGFDLIK